ncbi:MAG: L-2-amino-thiazoline-4-carboxylic acid hydrolase [Desulfobacterales bacterium]|jgi:hypothetical protein
MNDEQELREALRGAIQLRARMYYHIFCELRDEIGEDKASELMKRAIERGGRDLSDRFKSYAPADMEGLKDAFIRSVPDKGAMFQPEVCSCSNAHGLEIQFHACPLKETYEAMGLSDADKAKMLDIASAIDRGLFTGAGFHFSVDTWKPGRTGCCRLNVKPNKAE